MEHVEQEVRRISERVCFYPGCRATATHGAYCSRHWDFLDDHKTIHIRPPGSFREIK